MRKARGAWLQSAICRLLTELRLARSIHVSSSSWELGRSRLRARSHIKVEHDVIGVNGQLIVPAGGQEKSHPSAGKGVGQVGIFLVVGVVHPGGGTVRGPQPTARPPGAGVVTECMLGRFGGGSSAMSGRIWTCPLVVRRARFVRRRRWFACAA